MAPTTLHIAGPLSEQEKREADQFVADYIYGGSFELPSDGHAVTVDLSQIASRPCPIFVLKTPSHFSWRRSTSNIRTDGADICAIRVLRSGSARVTQAGRSVDMEAGDIVLNRSTLPIRVENLPLDGLRHTEMTIVLIPTAWLQTWIVVDQVINQPIPRDNAHYGVLMELLDLLAKRANEMADVTGEHLLNAIVNELVELVAPIASPSVEGASISSARLADIRAKIRTHFSNPNLSLEMIAQKCGISPRYVTYVMRRFGTSFYGELKSERLRAAQQILTGASRPMPIKQIAFFTGFKSASHFSAIYKREFGVAPSQQRSDAQTGCEPHSGEMQ